MKTTQFFLYSLACTFITGTVSATLIASANFTGMSATNVNSIAPSAGANDFTWTRINTNGDLSISTDDGTPGIGGGNALRVNASGTWQGVIGQMASAINLLVGETATFSFTGRYATSPANGQNLRFGFTTVASGDNTTYARAGTGGNSTFGLLVDTADDGSPGAGAINNLGASTPTPAYSTLQQESFSSSISIRLIS